MTDFFEKANLISYPFDITSTADFSDKKAGIWAGYKKENRGQRYSPGYPALTNLTGNHIIWNALKAADLGVTLTDANEFFPPSTTAAVICFHKDAGYS